MPLKDCSEENYPHCQLIGVVKLDRQERKVRAQTSKRGRSHLKKWSTHDHRSGGSAGIASKRGRSLTLQPSCRNHANQPTSRKGNRQASRITECSKKESSRGDIPQLDWKDWGLNGKSSLFKHGDGEGVRNEGEYQISARKTIGRCLSQALVVRESQWGAKGGANEFKYKEKNRRH